MPVDPEIRALLEQANLAMMPVLVSSAGSVLVSREQASIMLDAHEAIMKALADDDVSIAVDNAGVDELRHLDVESLVKARSAIHESIQRILPSDPEADAMADKEFAKAMPMRPRRPIPRKMPSLGSVYDDAYDRQFRSESRQAVPKPMHLAMCHDAGLKAVRESVIAECRTHPELLK